MSVSKWAYKPEKCDGDFCPGDCERCSKAEEMDIEEAQEIYKELYHGWVTSNDEAKFNVAAVTIYEALCDGYVLAKPSDELQDLRSFRDNVVNCILKFAEEYNIDLEKLIEKI